jgi:hemerythrin superfamily protein
MMAGKVGMSSKPKESPGGPVRVSTAPKGTSNLGAEDRAQRDIVELIRHDHSMIKMLYGQYVDSIDLEVKKAKVYSLIYEMSRHNACEELIFYSFLRTDPRIPDGFSIANRSVAEHAQITKQLAAVDKVHLGDPEWEAKLSSCVHAFMKHADEEEDSVLPIVANRLEARELLELGEKFENAETIVTTRPHPLSPTEGALGVAAHMAAKPIDMLRDAMQGRDAAIKEAINQEARADSKERGEKKSKDKDKKHITPEEAIST